MKLTSHPRAELLRFLFVGSIAVAIDCSLYAALVIWGGISPSWAKRMSFGIGSLWPFLGNKYFTFGIRGLRLREPFLFAIVYLIGLAVNSLTHDFLTNRIDSKAVVFLIATGFSTCCNFFGMKLFVFRTKDQSPFK
jgi:putative flippase GtrA